MDVRKRLVVSICSYEIYWLKEKRIRADKSKYVKDLAVAVEKAAREWNMRQIYDTTNKPAEKNCKPHQPIKDKEGKSQVTASMLHVLFRKISGEKQVPLTN